MVTRECKVMKADKTLMVRATGDDNEAVVKQGKCDNAKFYTSMIHITSSEAITAHTMPLHYQLLLPILPSFSSSY